MITMGIDASTTATGIGIFDNNNLIYYTTIKPKGQDWRDRLFHQGESINKIIEVYKPDKVYMEDVPLKSSGGLQTLVILGAVQGFIYGIMASHGVEVEFVSPNTWRSMAGLFDGTTEGKKRDVLKQKAIQTVNEKFGLNLNWVSPNSKLNEDDVAEAILICATMIGLVVKKKKFGRT